MSCFQSILFALLAVAVLSGCKKEDPTPELRDPIYSELSKAAKEYAEAVNATKEKVNSLKADLEKTEPNTIERKDVMRDLEKTQKRLVDIEQMRMYYEIRAERRKLVSRLSYKDAFAAGQEWPDPKEYAEYQASERLRHASRNWNDRVPKLVDRLPSSKPPAKKAEKKEEAEE